jgi:hypothetical protein
MPDSIVALCNIALGHLAVGTTIAALTEKSKEAEACAQTYPIVRDELLREFPWPFATRRVALALIDENPSPTWAYRYRAPTDAVAYRGIDTGYGRYATTAQSFAQFVVGMDDAGPTIETNYPAATMLYTARVEDPTFYPADFAQALSYRLASMIAPRVTGGDQFKLGALAFQQYQWMLGRAKVAALNEERVPPTQSNRLIDARGDGSGCSDDCDRSPMISSL